MSSKNFLSAALILGAMTALLAGCGGSNRDGVIGGVPGPIYPGPYPSWGPNPLPGCPGSPGCPPTGSGGADPMQDPTFVPTVSASFSIQGYSGTASVATLPAVNTDNLLRLRVIPLQTEQVSNTGYSPPIQCVDFLVTVSGLGSPIRTKLVTFAPNGAPCPGAYQNQFVQGYHGDIVDFSSRLTPGHGPLSITISQVRSTWNCQWWYQGYVYGPYNGVCPAQALYTNHKVTASVEVMTNGP
jgi:hypothetical protein